MRSRPLAMMEELRSASMAMAFSGMLPAIFSRPLHVGVSAYRPDDGLLEQAMPNCALPMCACRDWPCPVWAPPAQTTNRAPAFVGPLLFWPYE